MSNNLTAKVKRFAEISRRTALLSMTQRAEMRVDSGDRELSGSRSEPRIRAGQRGNPQLLESYRPEKEGPTGMSPSICLKPGKEGT